ncbi:hypothetical protein ACHAWF_014584, partial [Thalassiosira exigua]
AFDVAGGIGETWEDWVEQMHQVTSKKRKQYRSTLDRDLRGKSLSRGYQQDTDPGAVAYLAAVDNEACKGPRKDHVAVEEKRRQKRMERRWSTLEEWGKSQATSNSKAA